MQNYYIFPKPTIPNICEIFNAPIINIHTNVSNKSERKFAHTCSQLYISQTTANYTFFNNRNNRGKKGGVVLFSE